MESDGTPHVDATKPIEYLADNEGTSCYNHCRIKCGHKLYRCSGCKMALYCSKLCQKEHWYSGHNMHCKFLSGSRKLSNEHFKDYSKKKKICPFQKIMNCSKLFKAMLFNRLHGIYDSKYKYSEQEQILMDKMNLPFELGENTGRYIDKIDKTFGELMAILATVGTADLSLHGRCLTHFSLILFQRIWYWGLILQNATQLFPLCMEHDHFHHFDKLRTFSRDILKERPQFKNALLIFLLKYDRLSVESYKWSPLNLYKKDVVRNIKTVVNIIDGCSTEDDVNIIRDSIVHKTYNRGEYGKDQEFPCSSCLLPVNLESAQLVPSCDFNSTLVSNPSSDSDFVHAVRLHHKTYKLFFTCGSLACVLKINELYKKETASLSMTVNVEGTDHCDCCHEVCDNPHRCSGCKCKIYCSSTCQLKDWKKVHHKMCHLYKDMGHKNINTRDKFTVSYKDDESTKGSVSIDQIWYNQNRLKR